MAVELAHVLVHNLNIYLLNAYYVLSIVLGTGLSDETDLFNVFKKSTVFRFLG